MNNNIDLKGLWNKQEADIPDTKELFEKINAYKKRNFGKIIFTNTLLILTSAFIIFIWYYYQPEMISSKLGIVLIILAMAIFVFVLNQTLPLLTKVDFDLDIRESLIQLFRYREKQIFLQTTMLNIYFILLSAGICLYMFEYALKMTFLLAAISYFTTLMWIAFNWFYLRPRQIKKQRAKTDELIIKLEMLNRQISENE